MSFATATPRIGINIPILTYSHFRYCTSRSSIDYFGKDITDNWDDWYCEVSSARKYDNNSRYQSINDRTDNSLITREIADNIQLNKRNNYFKNSVCLKDPFDESILKQLIYDVSPRTIFEFGTFTGSSSSYIAMLLNEYQLYNSKILTFDITDKYRNYEINNDKFIKYVICDLNNDLNSIYELNSNKLLNEYEHPWLIIDDAHCNITNLLNYFDEYGMKQNDYIIIEDTLKYLQAEYSENTKLSELRSWLIKNEHKGYMIDAKYCDLWGYNMTWNANGYITKIK